MDSSNQTLHQMEKTYWRLLERLGALYLELAPDGTVLDVNGSAQEVCGYLPDELAGQNAWDLLFPGGFDAQVEPLLLQLRLGDVAHYPLTAVHQSGQPMRLDFNTANEYSPDGSLLKINALVTPAQLRRPAQPEAEQHEVELNQAQQIANLGSWVWGLPAGKLNWSQALYRIFGLSADSFTPTYENFLNQVHPDDRPWVDQQVRQALQSGSDFSFEHRILRPDGEERVLLAKGKVELGPDRSPVRMIGTAQDVTLAKRFERDLVLARDFYLTLFDQLPVMIWRAGLDAKTDYFNTSWLEFTGSTIQQELGEGWIENIHPRDRKRVRQVYQACYAGREAIELEFRLKHHSGDYRWVLFTGRPFYNLEGEFAGYIGSGFDLTERKDTEAAIRRSEENFRLVVEAIRNYAIFTLDTDGNVTSWNQGAQKIKGYAAREVLGQNFRMFYPPEALAIDKPKSLLEQARQEGRVEDEGWRVRKDGSRFWASSVLTAVKTENGELVGFVKVLRDMTSRKQAEEELKRQTDFVRLLQDVAVAANESVQIEDAIQTALDRVCELTGWKVGHALGLVEDGSNELQSFKVWHLDDPVQYDEFCRASENRRFRVGEGIPGLVLAQEKPLWWVDLADTQNMPRQELALKHNLRMASAFPIWAGKQVVGVLEFFSPDNAPADDGLIEVMTHIGTQIGRAVERHRSSLALRSSEVRFRTIFEGAPIGIQLVDLSGRLLACNPAFSDILGYDPKELRLLALKDQSHPANVVANSTLFDELRTGRRSSYRLERPYIRQDGRLVWGKLSVSLVRDATGQPQFAIGMLEDVSDRKQMEADLAELQRRLNDGREVERLHLAQELHDGPVQDLYGISYQLKSLAAELEDQAEREPLEEMNGTLQQVVHTLRTICGELRPPTLAPFGLERAIRSHADGFQDAHPEIQLALDLDPDGQLLPEAVRLALYRIYQQALNNIVRHSGANQVDVTLRLEPNLVFLAIKDNGKGFELPSRWIDLARQGHLGLVGAAERAEAIGGKLEVEAAAGRGTQLRVRVPRNFEQRNLR